MSAQDVRATMGRKSGEMKDHEHGQRSSHRNMTESRQVKSSQVKTQHCKSRYQRVHRHQGLAYTLSHENKIHRSGVHTDAVSTALGTLDPLPQPYSVSRRAGPLSPELDLTGLYLTSPFFAVRWRNDASRLPRPHDRRAPGPRDCPNHYRAIGGRRAPGARPARDAVGTGAVRRTRRSWSCEV